MSWSALLRHWFLSLDRARAATERRGRSLRSGRTPTTKGLSRRSPPGLHVRASRSTIIATDGAQGAANTSVPRRAESAKLRVEEARRSAQALGSHPPILLGFPDGALGHYDAF